MGLVGAGGTVIGSDAPANFDSGASFPFCAPQSTSVPEACVPGIWAWRHCQAESFTIETVKLLTVSVAATRA